MYNLIPTTAVAKALNISRTEVFRRVHDGRLTPAAKAPGIRGALLFDRADIEAKAGASC